MTLVVNTLSLFFTKNSEHGSLFLVYLRYFFQRLSLPFRTLNLVTFFCALLLLSACEPNGPPHKKVTFSGPMMGTQYRVTVLLDEKSQTKVNEIEKNIVHAMTSVNQSMSTYLPDSELSKLNRAEKNTKLSLSEPLYNVIKESLRVSELSKGAFDITVGRAVNLWGFGSGGKIIEYPSDKQLEQIKHSTGYQNIQLEGLSIVKKLDGMSLDLSSIAKGYAVDQVAGSLNDFGIENYLIDIGGELRAAGLSQSKKAWTVGIEKPYTLGRIQEVITLSNKSIATSGDYRNYHIIDGKQFSHTIDAATLKPVFHRLALVSVIDDNASTADALATAIMALGDEKGWAFAQQNNLIVYMVIRKNEKDAYRVKMTENFKPYLQ